MMRLFIRIGLPPQLLPFEAHDPAGRLWTDLANSEEGRVATGWGREAPSRPDDTDAQTAEWDASAEAWVMVDRPPPPPVPEPRPLTLGRLAFVRHVQEAGGMTDAMLVEARHAAPFAALWIKLDMASAVERDDPLTAQALGALAQAGYLPDGAAAVLAEWPVG